MAQDDLYKEFIEKLKKDKKPEELQKYLANLLQFSAEELYTAIMLLLTDEDMEVIDKIDDEKKAKEEIHTRFKLRTGKTLEEFMRELRDKVAKDYLFPELTSKNG